MKKLYSNKDIYRITKQLLSEFKDNNIILPIQINYSIQYNLDKLVHLYNLIEGSRNSLGEKYGTFLEEERVYKIFPENIEKAQMELDKLFEIEHNVDIKLVSLEDLKELPLTNTQMAALLFMIEEE